MGFMMGGGAPRPQATPPVPTVDDAQMRIDQARRDRERRGRAATEIVGTESTVTTAAKVLTGN